MKVRWVRDDEMADGVTVGVGTDRENGTPVVWHPYYALDIRALPGYGARSMSVWCFCESVRPELHQIAFSDDLPVSTRGQTWSVTMTHSCPLTSEHGRRREPRPCQPTMDVVVAMICHAWPGRPIEEDPLAATQLMNGLGVANPLDLFLIYHDALDQLRRA